MPKFEQYDTAVGYGFFAEFDGVSSMLQEVGPITAEVKVIDINHNLPDGKNVVKKVPGNPEGGTVTMKRGLTDDDLWEKWYQLAVEGKAKEMRKTGSIVITDYSQVEVARWNLENAWISKLEVSAAKAGDTSPMTETATVVFETIKRK